MHHLRAAWPMGLVCLAALTVPVPTPHSAAREAIVLGIAQDGGVPHLGCEQKLCREARRDPAKRRHVASLGLVDREAGKRFMIDATPDFPAQVDALGGLPDAILLTHAHIGHYLGLAQLGREVLNTRRLPVYCSAAMARFLRSNAPWSRLVERENIEIREIAPDGELPLTEHLRATPVRVPHRDEDSDTLAYIVRGPDRSLLWLPDIDKWEKWNRDVAQVVSGVDRAYLDGTFFSPDEIPGRSLAEIPHPLVPETVDRLRGAATPDGKIFFVHLNHTNRLYWDAAALQRLRRSGFSVAAEGDRFRL